MKKLYTFPIALISTSCNQNERVEDYGGLARLEISPDEVFVNATRRQTDLCVTTKKKDPKMIRSMRPITSRKNLPIVSLKEPTKLLKKK